MAIKKIERLTGNQLILTRANTVEHGATTQRIEIVQIGPAMKEKNKEDWFSGYRLANIPVYPAGRLIDFAGKEFAKTVMKLNPGDRVNVKITVEFEQEDKAKSKPSIPQTIGNLDLK